MKFFNQAKRYGAQFVAAGSAALLSAQVHAASLLPENALTTVGADAKDTAMEIALWSVGIIAVMSTTWFIATGTKKGLGKAGIK